MSLEDAINYLREQVPAFAKEVTPLLVYLRRRMRGKITGAFPTIKDVEGELYGLLKDWNDDMTFTWNDFLRVEKYKYRGQTRMRMMLIVKKISPPIEDLGTEPPNSGEDVGEEMKNNKGGKNMVKLSTDSAIFAPLHCANARDAELERLAIGAYRVKTILGRRILIRTLSADYLDFFLENYNEIVDAGEVLFSIRLLPKR